MTRTPHILWADDEIDLLKPHILFLQAKGYEVTGFTDGAALLEALEDERIVDVVFLDENMPGLTGLETLQRIKERRPHLPCVMITKSEEEHIMEEAIGSKMADYLIKPLNPNQILLSLKKILDEKRLVGEKAMSDYQREFRELGMRLMDRLGREDWEDIHKRLVHWDLELSASGDQGMAEHLLIRARMGVFVYAHVCEYVFGIVRACVCACVWNTCMTSMLPSPVSSRTSWRLK